MLLLKEFQLSVVMQIAQTNTELTETRLPFRSGRMQSAPSFKAVIFFDVSYLISRALNYVAFKVLHSDAKGFYRFYQNPLPVLS
mgnify:CR=1 FL=1